MGVGVGGGRSCRESADDFCPLIIFSFPRKGVGDNRTTERLKTTELKQMLREIPGGSSPAHNSERGKTRRYFSAFPR